MRNNELTNFFENRWGTYSVTYFFPPEELNTPHPIIIFVHGFRAKKEWYSWIGEFLASHGYLTLLFTVPSPKLPNPHQWSDGIKSAIDYLENNQNPLSNTICSGKIGAMGHSMGGLGALMAGSEDSRIKCIVGLAPAVLPPFLVNQKEIYNLPMPIQLQVGSNDGITSPENVKNFFNSLNSTQKSYVEIKSGNHIRFTNNIMTARIGEHISGILGHRFKDGRANITFEEQHSISSNSFIEWFNHYLKN